MEEKIRLYSDKELAGALTRLYCTPISVDALPHYKANIRFLRSQYEQYIFMRDNSKTLGNRTHYAKMIAQTYQRLQLWEIVAEELS